jgi:hypothetical protein
VLFPGADRVEPAASWKRRAPNRVDSLILGVVAYRGQLRGDPALPLADPSSLRRFE